MPTTPSTLRRPRAPSHGGKRSSFLKEKKEHDRSRADAYPREHRIEHPCAWMTFDFHVPPNRSQPSKEGLSSRGCFDDKSAEAVADFVGASFVKI